MLSIEKRAKKKKLPENIHHAFIEGGNESRKAYIIMHETEEGIVRGGREQLEGKQNGNSQEGVNIVNQLCSSKLKKNAHTTICKIDNEQGPTV